MKQEHNIKRGDIYRHCGMQYRVLCVTDGYVVARQKGCIPFCTILREWHAAYVKVTT